jgi:prepilin-type N-terminal cleavage/methylation domain-containing protein
VAKYKKQSGISLTEILVTISIMAILMAISVPAAKSLMASFESGTGARQLINAALSNARSARSRLCRSPFSGRQRGQLPYHFYHP